MGELVAMGLDAAELEARARMPPDGLIAMRDVMAGASVPEEFQWLVKLKEEKPREFLKDLRQWEGEWRDQVTKLGLANTGNGQEPERVGDEKALEVVEQWLKENGCHP